MFSRRDLVTACYQAILWRQPENEEVVISKSSHDLSAYEIITSFLSSSEYKTKAGLSVISDQYAAPPLEITLSTSTDQKAEMFSRIKKQWEKLGDSEPYWSVLTDEGFRSKNIEQNLEDFYSSGASTASLINSFYRRSHLETPTGSCLELGCGVGRVTGELAKQFDQVTGVDISKGNLRVARTHLTKIGQDNVNLVQINDILELNSLSNFDFFFSTIVLQHNPPPVQIEILDIILKKINKNGGVLFQIPTELPNYTFSTRQYLNEPESIMEMHCLPMHEVLNLLQSNDFYIKEIRPDGWTGHYGSYTFFAVKK